MNRTEITIIKGKSPVLFTAPHAHSHLRPNLTGTYRDAEAFTDTLAAGAADQSFGSALLVNSPLEYDPNYHEISKNPFKRSLNDQFLSLRPKIVIDLHGLSDLKQYDFGVYYPRRFSNSRRVAQRFAEALKKDPLLKSCTVAFLNSPIREGSESIAQFSASTLKVPSIQIETAMYIREDEALRSALIKALAYIASGY